MEAGCVLLLLLPFIRGGKRHTPPPHSFPYIFSLKKNLGHMPQRNAKCFNSFAPFLSGCHLQGLSLCPEVICSGWTIKAIMAAACFPIMKRDDWQQRDGVGVEGTWIQFIWSENIFFFSSTWVTKHKQTRRVISFRFFFFLNKTSYPILYVTLFNYLSHLPGQSDWEPQLGDAGHRMPAM